MISSFLSCVSFSFSSSSSSAFFPAPTNSWLLRFVMYSVTPHLPLHSLCTPFKTALPYTPPLHFTKTGGSQRGPRELMCDMTHSCVWHASSICASSCACHFLHVRQFMRDMGHSYVCGFMRVTRLMPMCDYSYIRVTWLIHMWAHSCVTWIIHMCADSCVWYASCLSAMTHSCVWRDSFVCARIHAWHESFICVLIYVCNTPHA